MRGRGSSPSTASVSSPSSRASGPPSGCAAPGRGGWTCPRSWRRAPGSACSDAPAHDPVQGSQRTNRLGGAHDRHGGAESSDPRGTAERLPNDAGDPRVRRTRAHGVCGGRDPGFRPPVRRRGGLGVGVCRNLDDRDTIASTHRGHGHCIAKGVDVREMMAEIYGRRTGSCHGKGGSMHIADLSKGMLGANGIVGGGPPLICGTALAAKLKGNGGVSVAFFGDGASNQGTTLESMNLASVWNLPAIFVAENNGYAETTSSTWSVASDNIADRAAGFGMPGVIVDGFDFFAVHEAASEAIARARAGGGPTLLEMKFTRYFGHFEGDQQTYRAGEVEHARAGVLGVTKGLYNKFPGRVLDTPISESAFIGAAIGAATAGMRPVAELMFVDFMGVCFDQIYNQAAKFRYMFGGKAITPVVIRTMYGAGLRAAAQHSQCLYPLFTHIPGLKVVMPSTPYDAKGMMIQAIRDNDPVMFFEHKALYDLSGPVPEESYALPFGEANVVREGGDVTIVSLGRMVHTSLDAAGQLAADGVQCEVVDLRTTSPLDEDTVLESVEGTGRLVVVDEAHPRCNVATDISALAARKAFGALRAPIEMVTAPHTPVPFSNTLEDLYVPDAQRIANAVKTVAEWRR